jgi:hypothetical protein
MSAADCPSRFRIYKRYVFISATKYYTIHFYNLIYELKNIKHQGHVLTTIRITTFLGGSNQLYYTHLAVPSNTHYREGSIINVKLSSPNDDDKKD